MRSVLLRFDDQTTEADVCQFLDEESVREPRQRARHVLDALCNIGTHHKSGAVYRLTPRGDRIRDAVLAEMAEAAKPAAKARKATATTPSPSKPPERVQTPKAARAAPSPDEPIIFTTLSGWRVCIPATKRRP
jgi:hypothetical protein